MELKIIDYSGEQYYLIVNGEEKYIGDYETSPSEVASKILKAIGLDYEWEERY